jgi:hypothetical protein
MDLGIKVRDIGINRAQLFKRLPDCVAAEELFLVLENTLWAFFDFIEDAYIRSHSELS